MVRTKRIQTPSTSNIPGKESRHQIQHLFQLYLMWIIDEIPEGVELDFVNQTVVPVCREVIVEGTMTGGTVKEFEDDIRQHRFKYKPIPARFWTATVTMQIFSKYEA